MIRRFEKECEVTLDYILPDYLGDIKRVLSARSKVGSEGMFMLDGGAECAGNVNIEVIYLDVDGNLCEFNVPCDFSCTFNIDMSAYRTGAVRHKVTQLTHRVTSARKMSFKSKILSTLECDFSLDAASQFDGAECESESVSVYSSDFLEKRENEYNTELVLDGSFEGEYEVLSSFGNVRVDESVVRNGNVTVSGEYIIGAIIKDENERVFVVKRSIPFEEIISTESEDGTLADSYADVVSLNIAADGEMKNKMNVNFTSNIFTCLSKNEKIDLVRDAYYKDFSSVCEYTSFDKSSVLTVKSFCQPIECVLPEDAVDVKCLRDLVAASIEAQSVRSEFTKSGVEISGDFAVSAVACEIDESGEISYSPLKALAPLNAFIPLDKELCCGTAECSVDVYDSDVLIDEKGVRITAEANITVKIFDTGSIQVVKSLQKGEANPARDASVFTVCFPDKGESLFSVAKRYGTTREKIARDNALAAETLSSPDTPLPKRLIIT